MKNKTVAALLAFFLGGLGIHQFYLGNGSKGIVYLIFCWTGVPFILAIIDLIMLLTMSEQAFDSKYNAPNAHHPQSSNITVNIPANQSASVAEELHKLYDLKEKGIINSNEFEIQKSKILAH